MKKLLFLVAAAIGVVAIAKSRSEQLKTSAAKVTSDPRVQSALATASEKAGPVASTVKEKAAPVVSSVGEKVSHATERLHQSSDGGGQHAAETPSPAAPVDVPEVPPAAEELVEEHDPVSAPEFTGTDQPPAGSQPAE